MTATQPPRTDPLQDDELDLQRVLRALPTTEPSARVDAAILAAATDAASPAPRRGLPGLRWLPTWAIGTAAAAVLAIGVGTQLRPALAPEAAAPSAASKATPALPPARERLSVDLVEPERELAPMPGPPPESPLPQATRATAPAPPPAPIVANEAPAPAAFAEAEIAVESASSEEDLFASDAAAAAPAPAPTGSAAAGMLDRIEVTGSRLDVEGERADAIRQQRAQSSARAETSSAVEKFEMREAPAQDAATPEASPPASVELDAQLEPRAWLERIRERRQQGDTAGARASLQLFIQTYPDAPLPSDLARLR